MKLIITYSDTKGKLLTENIDTTKYELIEEGICPLCLLGLPHDKENIHIERITEIGTSLILFYVNTSEEIYATITIMVVLSNPDDSYLMCLSDLAKRKLFMGANADHGSDNEIKLSLN